MIQITGRTQYQNFTEWQQHNSGGLPSEENLDFLVDYDIVDRRNNFASIHNWGIEVIRTAGIFMVAFLSLVKYDVASAQTQSSQEEQTLCNEDEEVYFSCPLENGKTVSVCAKNNTDPERGFVQYRYGSKNDAFIFPPENAPPAKTVKITDVSEGSIRGLHLKFLKEPYTYVVSSVSPGGLYVSKNGKVIFDKECQASRCKSFSNKIFDGVNEAPVTKVDMH
ncbi:hypothetical protein [Paraburkholderia terricola]|uniref:Uncharacterized protein n=1 Tax=Paraburkholderia terricola TaxID=169427 RepID=A0ABU1M0H1_9BURK|nr:hypothetical protein [Paraburkholderia terricola]MDR6412514.1 hypothetical protein [Paraburkholderia terricola]MDR6485480.1 hypothetical protein [Paraburkholderia terricola]